MKLQKFKERNKKQKSIIIFTIACVLLISGVFLYKSFASFQVIKNQDYINGSIEDPGDIYFAFYKDNKIQKEMPTKEQGYVLDEENSYCGITGGSDSNIKVHVTEDNMIHVSGVTTSRTKCNLYFVKGIYLLGKGVPVVTSGDGLYEVRHDDNELEEKWKTTEYRYAGSNPKNRIRFNNETWKIIGLVNVLTSEDKVEQRVKIVSSDAIGSFPWDYKCTASNLSDCSFSNDWGNAILQNILNEKYLQSDSFNYYYRVYGDSTVFSGQFNFNENYLKDNYVSMIDTVFWNVGLLDEKQYKNNQDKNELYCLERQNNETWQGKIALLLPSDGAYTFSDDSFLAPKTWYWSLRTSSTNDMAVTFFSDQTFTVSADYLFYRHFSSPALYLKPTVTIMSGTGAPSDAFQLIQILK